MSHNGAIQPTDDGSTRKTVQDTIADRREDERRRQSRSVEADVRQQITTVRDIISNPNDERDPAEYLWRIHQTLWDDPDIDQALDTDAGLDKRTILLFKRYYQKAREGRYVDPEEWLAVVTEVAKTLDFLGAFSDPTWYVDVRMAPLSGAGVQTPDEPTPIGKRRLPASSTLSEQEAEVEISHESCDHIGIIAGPRQGKDSTMASIGMNLAREHGYKYISIFDDGRMETPMLPIPNDEQPIRQNLDQLGQEPAGMPATIYVPANEETPDLLPANFQEFTISIGDLTPRLILRLAGISKTDEEIEHRIEDGLQATLDNSGNVDELVTRLQSLAREQDSTITWEEERDEETGDGEYRSYTVQCELPAEDALQTASVKLAKLASQGIIAGRGAETNIDMKQVVETQSEAAVLCANFLPDGSEELKYTLIDIWLRLIHRVRQQYQRTPRVVLGCREIRDLAPSQLGNVWYQDAKRALKQTFVFLASQGGSRGILILGSTQKWNDISRAVRSKFLVKILLKQSEDEMQTLEKMHDLSQDQREKLLEFPKGWGMVIANGNKYYPIQFRGAPCALGDKDRHWLDRYGEARGARVLRKYQSWGGTYGDEPWWVHVPDCEVYDGDNPPEVGDYYNPWFLVASDFPDDTSPGDVDQQLVERVLADRREYDPPCDISLRERSIGGERSVVYRTRGEAIHETVEDLFIEYDVPRALDPFLLTEEGKVRRDGARETMLRILDIIASDDTTIEKLRSFSEQETGVPFSTASNYIGDDKPLADCVDTTGGEYTLTTLGQRARNVPWGKLAESLDRPSG